MLLKIIRIKLEIMLIMDKYSSWLKKLFLLCLIIILPPTLINFFWNYQNTCIDHDCQAACFQEKNKAIVIIPANVSLRFKHIRIQQKKDEINTLFLGSSSIMSINQKLFSDTHNIYNLASNGNNTHQILCELKYFSQNKKIKNFIITLDIYIPNCFEGFINNKTEERFIFSSEPPLQRKSFYTLLIDSITLDKFKALTHEIKSIFNSQNKKKDFKKIFFLNENKEKCPDGSTAYSFGKRDIPGVCPGFRDDGSATFGFRGPKLANHEEISLSSVFLYESVISKYNITNISSNQNFSALAQIVQNIKTTGRTCIFLIPPLMPSLEKQLLKSSQHSKIVRLKKELHDWAIENKITIIDAAAAEEYHCSNDEFLDEHHAFSSCYKRFTHLLHSTSLPYGVVSVKDLIS